jgi:hypothetical protein
MAMEIIAIEKKAFVQTIRRFENFTRQVKELCGDNRNGEKWMDNTEVCKLLQISGRTLQTYRDNGTLPYSRIGRKCYYRASDAEKFIVSHKTETDKIQQFRLKSYSS